MKNISQAVARVYAEALLDLSTQQGNLPRVVDDLHAVLALTEKDPTFRSFWASHRLERKVKKGIVTKALGDRIDRPVLGLLHVLVDKQRELVLDNIVAEFDRYRDIREGRLHAHVTSAKPLAEDQKADIVRRLEASTGKKIRLHEKVEPGVLGGLSVKLKDRIIDGTARSRLDRLRRALMAVAE